MNLQSIQPVKFLTLPVNNLQVIQVKSPQLNNIGRHYSLQQPLNNQMPMTTMSSNQQFNKPLNQIQQNENKMPMNNFNNLNLQINYGQGQFTHPDPNPQYQRSQFDNSKMDYSRINNNPKLNDSNIVMKSIENCSNLPTSSQMSQSSLGDKFGNSRGMPLKKGKKGPNKETFRQNFSIKKPSMINSRNFTSSQLSEESVADFEDDESQVNANNSFLHCGTQSKQLPGVTENFLQHAYKETMQQFNADDLCGEVESHIIRVVSLSLSENGPTYMIESVDGGFSGQHLMMLSPLLTGKEKFVMGLDYKVSLRRCLEYDPKRHFTIGVFLCISVFK